MTLLYILFALEVLLLLIDFKKGVLIFAPLKLFFNSNVHLLTSPSIGFDLAVCSVILLIYIVRYYQKWKYIKFPLSFVFIAYCLIYSFTCLYPSFVPSSIPRIVISVFVYSYIYFKCIQTRADLKFAILSYVGFAIIMCGNGLLQWLFNINPLDDYIQSIADQDSAIFSENDLSRFLNGKRVRSFIPHSISYGVACVSILFLIITFALTATKYLKPYIVTLISTILLILGIMSCGSRTPIIGLLPLFFFSKNIFRVIKKRFFSTIILIAVALYFTYDYIAYSIESIINPTVAAEAGGSDIGLRLLQTTVTLNYFSQSPIFGNGIDFDMGKYTDDIAGGESVWFPLLAQSGLIGTLGYVFLYVGLYRLSIKMDNKWLAIGFITSWLIMRTATSLIGVGDSMLLTIFFIIYKYDSFTKVVEK